VVHLNSRANGNDNPPY